MNTEKMNELEQPQLCPCEPDEPEIPEESPSEPMVKLSNQQGELQGQKTYWNADKSFNLYTDSNGKVTFARRLKAPGMREDSMLLDIGQQVMTSDIDAKNNSANYSVIADTYKVLDTKFDSGIMEIDLFIRSKGGNKGSNISTGDLTQTNAHGGTFNPFDKLGAVATWTANDSDTKLSAVFGPRLESYQCLPLPYTMSMGNVKAFSQHGMIANTSSSSPLVAIIVENQDKNGRVIAGSASVCAKGLEADLSEPSQYSATGAVGVMVPEAFSGVNLIVNAGLNFRDGYNSSYGTTMAQLRDTDATSLAGCLNTTAHLGRGALKGWSVSATADLAQIFDNETAGYPELNASGNLTVASPLYSLSNAVNMKGALHAAAKPTSLKSVGDVDDYREYAVEFQVSPQFKFNGGIVDINTSFVLDITDSDDLSKEDSQIFHFQPTWRLNQALKKKVEGDDMDDEEEGDEEEVDGDDEF